MRFPLAGGLVLAWLLSPWSCQATEKSCEDQVRTDPCAEGSARCRFQEAQSSGRGDVLRQLVRNHPTCPWAHSYLGDFDWADAQRAVKDYRTAAQLFAKRGETAGEVQVRVNLYQRLADMELYDEASAELRSAAEAAKRAVDPVVRMRVQVYEAKDLWRKGEHLGSAYARLEQAKTMLIPGGPERLQRECLLDLGNVCLELGRRTEAESVFHQLVAMSSQAGDLRRVASARYGLAQVLIEGMAELPAETATELARAAARQALASAKSAGQRTIEQKSHWILGMLTAGSESEGHFASCLNAAEEPGEKSYCLSGLARRLAILAPAKAEPVARRALALAETSPEPRWQAYALGGRMRVGWATGPLERAISDSEDALSQIETLRARQETPESSSGLFSTWSDDYDWFAGHLLETGRPDLLAQAFDVMEHLRGRALLDSLGKAQALTGQRPGRAAFASLREVQAQLAEDEALFSYQIAPWKDWTGDFGGGSWLLVVTRRGPPRAVPLRAMGRETARQKVDQLVALFESRVRQSDREAALEGTLYRDLLAPGLAGLPPGVRKLIVLPDDALHRLPFGALREARGAEPLAARFEVVTAPSATLWRRWRREAPSPALAGALALANPVRLGGLPALPAAEMEGRQAVGALGGRSVLRTGEEASEQFVKRGGALAGFAVFHLATHTVVDERDPSGSAVRLTPGHGEDGFLRESEIVALPLGGKLVVLSSCSSARGETLRGEGVLSLARAFFAGGAHAVVASLWPLRDDEAEALFARFYHHLGSGLPVGAALRAAQRDRIADGARPEAWAGLVAIGDGDLRPVPRARPRTRAGG